MRRLLLIIVLLSASISSSLAQSLTFVDAEDNQPIPGVVVQIQSIDSDKASAQVTDDQGNVVLPSQFPVRITTRHLSYLTYSDTLHEVRNYRIALTSKINQLGQVIVTGQFQPQSAENSVFKVQTIEVSEIKERSALNLAEVLNNRLNIRFSQDLAIGSTGISLQGISSQNVKILVDGVPLVGRAGNGNAADLSQINLQNIERIEIVEGPMAVNFGANALAGVINLITKKNFENRTEVGAYLQTESAGSEYGLDKGRHIQSVSFNHRFDQKWSVLVSGQHNDFLGYEGDANPRQHEWNPKRQWIGNGLIKYESPNHTLHYRFDLLDELIQDFGIAQNNFLPSGENQPFALDETYASTRYSHQLQAQGKLSFLDRYTSYFSFTDFERQKSRFARNLVTGEENLTTGEGDQDLSTYRVWDFGGTGFTHTGRDLDLQFGYQISLEEVGGGRILDGQQGIEEVAVYASAEWRVSPKAVFRPGFRFTNNSSFGNQFIPSTQFRYSLSEDTQLRLSYGRGFRTPSVRELYFEFVDSNHRIFGNPDLQPEKSDHISVNIAGRHGLFSAKTNFDLNVFFNDIREQISLGQDVNDATSTTYLNIARFKTLGATFNQTATLGAFELNVGVSYIGRYNRLSDEEEGLRSFFYSPEVSTNVSYKLPNQKTSFNAFYKYTGRLQGYFTSLNEQNQQEVSIGEVSDFHLLDVTALHRFNPALELTFGIRNLANIQRINNSGLSGGAHGGGASVPVSYGRSYFLKLSYNLNLK